ncbi:MAG: hypothetical protein L6Q57_09810 [Alphaproteobacteria bacterium]|nr:hypothetical protein [Alphaproteobacteria bacterium]
MEEYTEIKWDEAGNILIPSYFEEAIKLIKFDPNLAIQVSDLSLHRRDLIFAKECLEKINETEDKLIKKALWASAIVHYMKCFGSGFRGRLKQDEIFKNDPEGLEFFAFFKDLRDKHFVHDVNSFMQGISFAVLNKKESECKIAKILSTSFLTLTLEQANYSNLALLVQRTLSYVQKEYSNLCELITKELEALPHKTLLEFESPVYTTPRIEDVNKRRKV